MEYLTPLNVYPIVVPTVVFSIIIVLVIIHNRKIRNKKIQALQNFSHKSSFKHGICIFDGKIASPDDSLRSFAVVKPYQKTRNYPSDFFNYSLSGIYKKYFVRIGIYTEELCVNENILYHSSTSCERYDYLYIIVSPDEFKAAHDKALNQVLSSMEIDKSLLNSEYQMTKDDVSHPDVRLIRKKYRWTLNEAVRDFISLKGDLLELSEEKNAEIKKQVLCDLSSKVKYYIFENEVIIKTQYIKDDYYLFMKYLETAINLMKYKK